MSVAAKRAMPNRMLKVEKDNENKYIRRKVTSAEIAQEQYKPKKQFGNPKKCDGANESAQEGNKSSNRPMRLCEIMRTRTETAKKRAPVPTVHLVGPVHRNPMKISPVRKSHLRAGSLRRRNPSPPTQNATPRAQPLVRVINAADVNASKRLLTPRSPSIGGGGNVIVLRRTLGNGLVRRNRDKVHVQPIIIEELSPSSEWNPCIVGKLPFIEEPESFIAFNDMPTDFESFSESAEEFVSAAPLSDRTTTTVDSLDYSTDSSKILNNFREVLASKKKSMKPEELDVIKSVIKADSRHRHLRKADPGMVKSILKSQLEDIMTKESVIVTALKELDTEEYGKVEKVTETTVSYFEDPRKSRVDVIFKNVRSREREIIVLKALTEEMEAKLQCMESPRGAAIDIGQCLIATQSLERVMYEVAHLQNASVETKSLGVVRSVAHMRNCAGSCRVWHEVSVLLANEQNACIQMHPIGVLRQKGVVDEYLILQKTLSQLKREAENKFYLPIDDREADMLCTSYKKLQRDMHTLVRYLKPKSDLVPFNNLDRDPTLLNRLVLRDQAHSSAYSSICVCSVYSDFHEQATEPRNESSDEVELRDAYIEYGMMVKDEQGAQCTVKVPDAIEWLQENMDAQPGCSNAVVLRSRDETVKGQTSPKIDGESLVHEDLKEEENGNNEEYCKEIVELKIVERAVEMCDSYTTTTLDPEVAPDNAVFKTVLVGVVQMVIFVVFIMALSYPYPICEI